MVGMSGPSENGYERMAPSRLKEMLGGNYKDGEFGSWIQAFCSRKYNSDFSREMSRSVEAYLGPFTSDAMDAR